MDEAQWREKAEAAMDREVIAIRGSGEGFLLLAPFFGGHTLYTPVRLLLAASRVRLIQKILWCG